MAGTPMASAILPYAMSPVRRYWRYAFVSARSAPTSARPRTTCHPFFIVDSILSWTARLSPGVKAKLQRGLVGRALRPREHRVRLVVVVEALALRVPHELAAELHGDVAH